MIVLRSTYDRDLAEMSKVSKHWFDRERDARERVRQLEALLASAEAERDYALERRDARIAEAEDAVIRADAAEIVNARLQAEVTRLTAELARRSERPRGADGKFLRGGA